jgi:hypothetical protein
MKGKWLRGSQKKEDSNKIKKHKSKYFRHFSLTKPFSVKRRQCTYINTGEWKTIFRRVTSSIVNNVHATFLYVERICEPEILWHFIIFVFFTVLLHIWSLFTFCY